MVKKALLGQFSDTDIRLLRVFRAVVECSGFSAAELELNIDRSTISRHIKDFEIRLGVNLCRRGRGGFALTPEGQQVYEAGLRLLASIDEFRAEVNDVHQSLSGNLSLAIFDKTATNPKSAIHQALQLFDDIAPAVSVEIYVDTITEIERGIMEGRYHVGIIPSHRASSSMDYYPLFDEQMYLYCGKQHPLFGRDKNVGKEEILSCKYAGIGYHSPNMETGRKLDMHRTATVYDQEAVAHLVLSGRYLGYLPDHYAKYFMDQGLMKPTGTELFQYQCQFNAIVRHSPAPSRVTSTFVNALKQAHQKARE